MLVENGQEILGALHREFPRARFLGVDAVTLRSTPLYDARKAGAAISGLPLLAMQTHKVAAILLAVFEQLEDGGVLHQLTYGPRAPVPRRLLDQLGLQAVRIRAVPANLPPASVYRITAR